MSALPDPPARLAPPTLSHARMVHSPIIQVPLSVTNAQLVSTVSSGTLLCHVSRAITVQRVQEPIYNPAHWEPSAILQDLVTCPSAPNVQVRNSLNKIGNFKGYEDLRSFACSVSNFSITFTIKSCRWKFLWNAGFSRPRWPL